MNAVEVADYLKGVADCSRGKPHTGKSKAYDDGYSDQYAEEQRETQKTITGLYNGNRKLN